MAKEKPFEAVMDSVFWSKQIPDSYWRKREIAPYFYSAKRFILTDEASIQAGEIMDATEGHMIRNHQFALAPYPVTYIEVNTRLLLQAANRKVAEFHGADPDERVGYLIVTKGEDITIYPFARGVQGDAGPSALVLAKRSAAPRFPFPKELGDMKFARLATLLGTGVHAYNFNDDPQLVERTGQAFQEILRYWGVIPMYPNHRKLYEDPDTFRMGTGELRNVLVTLLILNQPTIINTIAVGRQARLRKGKRVVYAAHSTVEINLGRRKNYIRLFDYPTDRASPRRHSVRGHFVHYHIDRNCTHEWPSFPDPARDVPTWECRKCGGRRVWRESFERGDAGIGYVTKDYSLT